MKSHTPSCKLAQDHYGPCSEHEHECWVEHPATGEILWRMQLPDSVDYGTPGWEAYADASSACRQAAVEAAIRLGGYPMIRHHSKWTDAVTFPIRVREATLRGDLILTLPWGEYVLEARRDDKTDALPTQIYGRVCRGNHGVAWCFQPSHVTYSDGSRSEWLGCYPRDLAPFANAA